MKFGNFQILTYLIWLVPVFMAFYLWAAKREQAVMEKFAQKELLPGIAPFYDKDRRNLRIFLNVTSIFLIVFALSRPQCGSYWKDDERMGLDIVFAVDTSRSMLAVDMKPDRLSFARAELMDFVKGLKGDRVALIAFSGEAFMQCPLTTDYSGFLLALNDLDTGTIPRGGTSIPFAVEEAVRGYKGAETNNKVMIIITDGENTEGDVGKAIGQAKKDGIMISCIGMGTPEGEVIPVADEKGRRTYLKDKDGKIVRSRLMEDTLKTIAAKTGGIYVRANQTDLGLKQIYQQRLSKLEKKRTEDKKVKAYKERFQFPLALAFLMLLSEFILRGKSGNKKSG